jgi:N-acyl amino acid synthase of PEP-CTERM/exosortase system
LLDQSFRLRYKVYVDETQFERAEDFPTGHEHDLFDPRALTVLLRHSASGHVMGCVRLIVADPADVARPFPFEIVAGEQIASRSEVFLRTPRKRIGEVSRLAVAKEFRRRKSDQEMGLFAVQDLGNQAEDPRRRNIPPALGLVFAAAWLGVEIGLNAVFVMMELRLARLLRSLGLSFNQVAEPIEYHGLRAPFEITRESLLGEMSPPLRSALDLVQQRVQDLAQLDFPLLNAVRERSGKQDGDLPGGGAVQAVPASAGEAAAADRAAPGAEVPVSGAPS